MNLVSVLVASYNHAAYVVLALESVCKQTYKNIELIVVDDASSDETFTLAKSFVEQKDVVDRFSRIILIQNRSNMGAHATFNFAMSLVQGDFLTFLNSDDLYHPTRIQDLVAATDKSELLFSAVEVIDENGKQDKTGPLAHSVESSAFIALRDLPCLSFGLLKQQIAVTTGNIFISNSLQKRIGEFADLKYCHDWEFLLRACIEAEPYFVAKPLYSYRIHSGNSYQSLGHVAHAETRQVLQTYFRGILGRVAPNNLAPTPYNWPILFEHLVAEFKIAPLWNAEAENFALYAKRIQSRLHLSEVHTPLKLGGLAARVSSRR